MKKFLLNAVLLFSVLVSGAATFEKTYHFSKPDITIAGNFEMISFSGLQITGPRGEPALPYLAINMALPPGEILDFVEVVPGTWNEIPGKHLLYPVQGVRPVSEGSTGNFYIKETVYESKVPYPVSLHGRVSTGFLKGVSIGNVHITPVMYHPALQNLGYYSSLTVKFHTKPDPQGEEALKNLYRNEAGKKEISELVDNPGMLASYPLPKADINDYQILVVTTALYENSFSNLVLYYLKQGMKTHIINTNTINTQSTGQDLAEKIRNYIRQEYQNHGIDYVLLGGDVNVIPYRGFYCQVQSSSLYEDWDIPSDLYYSSLDGNWDTNSNHIWGEIGEDDLFPEVAVGRLPFSNIQECNNLVAKDFSYQNTSVPGEQNRVLMLGENLYENPLTWGCDYLDLLIGHHTNNGYITDGIDTNRIIEKLYDRDLPAPWDPSDMLDMLQEGYPFIHHSGHSSTDYNLRLYQWDIVPSNFQNLDGTHHTYSIIYSHGCYSASFDSEDCIAEDMMNLNLFAVAYVGNSRYGWFNEGQTEGPSEHLHREFVNALYHNKFYRIGETHRQSRIQSSSWVNAPGQWEEGALRWCFYGCNVLGDPVMGIWTDIPKIPTTWNYPNYVPAYASGMAAQILYSGIPQEGTTCALLQNNTLLGYGVTDAQGNVQINFEQLPTVLGGAELYVSGYNRLVVTSFPVIISGTAGTSELEAALSVAVSPNPFKDQLTLSIQLSDNESVTIEIATSEGKQVFIDRKQLDSGRHIIDLTGTFEELASGAYFIKVQGTTSVITRKLVKQ